METATQEKTMTAERRMRAKFTGRCRRCNGAIAVGDFIYYSKETGTRHADDAKCSSPVPASAPTFDPTREQEEARTAFATGASLVIEAGAGTGKTATLVLLARDAEKAKRRGQYIAFNKSIVEEAGTKFPANVACSTAHSLAYKAIIPGTRYAARLKNSRRMKSTELATRLRVERIKVTLADGTEKTLSATFLAGLAIRGVTRFCQSADLEPEAKHVPYIDGIDVPPVTDGRRNRGNNDVVARALVPVMRRAWADLIDEHGSLPFKHDHYLKLWHLSGPKINADFILFDEAQDANPVLMDIVRQQSHAQLVWVGDSQQQIYTFTGAVNALQAVGASQTTFLTQSFRFGPAIADVANTVLEMLPEALLRLSGTESVASVVETVDDPDAILCRTNARAVRHLLDEIAAGRHPHIVGKATDVVDFAKAARDLMADGFTGHPELACFDSWGEVQLYVEQDEQGGDLLLLVKLIDDFGVDTIISALENMPEEKDASVVISTAHKAKGREWNAVQLADDFPAEPAGEELRLLYVAVTRARRRLDVTAVRLLSGGWGVEAGEDEDLAVQEPVSQEPADADAAAPAEASQPVSAPQDAAEAPSQGGSLLSRLAEPAGVVPEGVQLALGELGEALMKDGPACHAAIERAIEHLRTVSGPTTDGTARHYSVEEDVAGRPGRFEIRNGRTRQELFNGDSRDAMGRASAWYRENGHRTTVIDLASGELVVEYDA